jgi:GAF domain-containing protein
MNVSFDFSREFSATDLDLLARLAALAADRLKRLSRRRAPAEARDRQAVFDQVVGLARTSPTLEAALSSVVRLMSAHLDCWCGALTRGPDGTAHLVAGRHPDAARTALMNGLLIRWPPRHASSLAVRCLTVGQTVVYQAVPNGLLAEVAVDDEHLKTMRRVGIGSLVAAPIRGRNGVAAALCAARLSGRVLTDADVRLVEDLALAASSARVW